MSGLVGILCMIRRESTLQMNLERRDEQWEQAKHQISQHYHYVNTETTLLPPAALMQWETAQGHSP